jgi:cyclic pyranopterin phosphate synthase
MVFDFKELRISITNRCNLNCLYCKKEGIPESNYEMTKEEILELIYQVKKFKVKKVKFSGGEPLIRKDLVEIIESIPKGIVKSISTNGILLNEGLIKKLYDAGLDEVVISLDSLKKIPYNIKCESEKIEKVIKVLKEYDFRDIRLDVVLSLYNIDQIKDFIEFANSNEIHLRFLEIQTFNDPELKKLRVDLNKVEEEIKKYSVKEYFNKSRLLKVFKTSSDICILLTYSLCDHEACGCCVYGRGHVRVTPDGKLLPCLMESYTIDILEKIRRKESIDEEIKLCIEFMERKANREVDFSYIFNNFH